MPLDDAQRQLRDEIVQKLEQLGNDFLRIREQQKKLKSKFKEDTKQKKSLQEVEEDFQKKQIEIEALEKELLVNLEQLKQLRTKIEEQAEEFYSKDSEKVKIESYAKFVAENPKGEVSHEAAVVVPMNIRTAVMAMRDNVSRTILKGEHEVLPKNNLSINFLRKDLVALTRSKFVATVEAILKKDDASDLDDDLQSISKNFLNLMFLDPNEFPSVSVVQQLKDNISNLAHEYINTLGLDEKNNQRHLGAFAVTHRRLDEKIANFEKRILVNDYENIDKKIALLSAVRARMLPTDSAFKVCDEMEKKLQEFKAHLHSEIAKCKKTLNEQINPATLEQFAHQSKSLISQASMRREAISAAEFSPLITNKFSQLPQHEKFEEELFAKTQAVVAEQKKINRNKLAKASAASKVTTVQNPFFGKKIISKKEMYERLVNAKAASHQIAIEKVNSILDRYLKGRFASYGPFAYGQHKERSQYVTELQTEIKKFVKKEKNDLEKVLIRGLTSLDLSPRRFGDYPKSLQFNLVVIADELGMGASVPKDIRTRYDKETAKLTAEHKKPPFIR